MTIKSAEKRLAETTELFQKAGYIVERFYAANYGCIIKRSDALDTRMADVRDVLNHQRMHPFELSASMHPDGYQTVCVIFGEAKPESDAMRKAREVAEWAKAQGWTTEITQDGPDAEVFVMFTNLGGFSLTERILEPMRRAELPAPDDTGVASFKGKRYAALTYEPEPGNAKLAKSIAEDVLRADAIFWPELRDREAQAQELLTALKAAGLAAVRRGHRVVTFDPKSDRLESKRVIEAIPAMAHVEMKLKYERGSMPKTDGSAMEFVRITVLEG